MARSNWCLLVTVASMSAVLLTPPAASALDNPTDAAVLLRQETEPETSVRWQAIDTRAAVDRDGVLRVTERVRLAVTGEMGRVARMFRTWVMAEVAVTAIARLDPSTGELRPLAPGALDAVDQYEFSSGILRWTVRGPDDPGFRPDTPLSYQVDYSVSGSVIPIWGVRGFGTRSVLSTFILLHPLRRASELWETWRLTPGGLTDRYLLDFDFSPFPFAGGNPIDRFSLDLRLDPSWRPLAMPRPLRAGVAADEDLRDLVLLEFSGPGTPAGVHRAWHALWLVPLILGPAGVIALVAYRIAHVRRQKRRLDLTRVDEGWIREHVLSRPAAAIRRLAAETGEGGPPPFFGAVALLEDMARDGILALAGTPDGGTLTLHANREALPPAERAVADALFGASRAVTAEETRRRIAREGLDLDRVARKALDAAYAARPSAAARARRAASPVLIGLAVVLTLSALEPGGFFALATGLVVGSFVSQLGSLGLPRFAGSMDLPTWRLALLALPAIVFPVGQIGFFLAMPAHPIAIVGQALLWVGLTNVMVNSTRSRWTEAEIELRYQLSRARQHIGAELEKKRPELDDDWLPWILALGLKDEVENWRRGRGMFATRSPEPGATPAVRWTGGTEAPRVSVAWAQRFLYGAAV